MINKVFYQNISQVGEHINQTCEDETSSLIITPSPETADRVRAIFQSEDEPVNIQVVTFSNFINSLKKTFPELDNKKIYRKSEQLLILGAAYRKMNPAKELSYVDFENYYTILTDLKSYSLQYDVLNNILEEYSPVIREQVLKLFLLQQELDLVDEHQALFELGEAIRSEIPDEYAQKSQLVFIGFEHVSAVQIDFFRTLSLRSQLFFYIPRLLKDHLLSTDWLSWLEGDSVEYSQGSEIEKTVAYYKVNQIDFATRIYQHINNENISFYLAGKNNEPELQSLFTGLNRYQKRSADLFSCFVEKLHTNTLQYLVTHQEVSLEDLGAELDRLIGEAIEEKNYPYLKTIIEFKKLTLAWADYFAEKIAITQFELDLIKEIVTLDLPRLYDIQFKPETKQRKITQLDYLSQESGQTEEEREVVIYFSESSLNKGSASNHLAKVYSTLSFLGPIHRSELANYFMLSGIEGLTSQGELSYHFYLDEKLLKETEIASHLEKIIGKGLEFSHERRDHSVEEKKKEAEKRELDKDLIQSLKERKHSANSLQTYLDCPQKYFVQYSKGSFSPPALSSVLNPFEKGSLLHLIVEKFFKLQFKGSFQPQVREFIVNEINLFFKLKGKKLNHLLTNDLKTELTYKSEKMLYFLQKILLKFKLDNFFNEYSLSQNHDSLSGSIDFLAYNLSTVVVLDLKSSIGSQYTKKSILNFDLIQIWFYLRSIKQQLQNKNILFGYVGFKNVIDSTLFWVGEKDENLIGEVFLNDLYLDTSELKINFISREEFNQSLEDFENFYEEVLKNIDQDEVFPPSPRVNTICSFCDLNQICKKDGVSLLW